VWRTNVPKSVDTKRMFVLIYNQQENKRLGAGQNDNNLYV